VRLFLKTVQHIYALRKSDGIDGTISVSVLIFHDLQYAWALALPRLPAGCFPPNWAMLRAVPIPSLTASGNASKSRFEEPTQYNGSSPRAGLRIGESSQF